MEKFAEDDRIEQMNARKRRMKQIEHKRAIENLLEERRHKLELEKVDNIISNIYFCQLLIYLYRNIKLRNILMLNVLNKFVKKLLKKNVLNYLMNMHIVY